MHTFLRHSCAALVLVSVSLAYAQDADFEEGKKLYEKECMVCHGFNNAGKTSEFTGMRQQFARTQGTHSGATLVDAGGEIRLAVAPPFGPNLGGVVGRPAGTVEGFNYSAPFLKNLKGMIWDEGSLNTWLTSTQRWVPGVTMYYSQKDPEVRRKIIQYLKANP
jgi:cytochrome c2